MVLLALNEAGHIVSINESLSKEPTNKGKTVHLDIQPPTIERTVLPLNSQLRQQMMRLGYIKNGYNRVNEYIL